MALTANESNIFKLVAGLFNGAPGKNIQTDLSNIVAAGTSLSELANILVGTLEFQSIVPAGQAAQADFLLKNFGFDPAATDEATTVAKAFVNDNFGLGLGQLAYLAVDFLNTTTDPVFADAAALLNNKALVAGVHADNVDAIAGVAAGQAAFVGVTASGPTTAEAALALLEDNGVVVPDPGQPGQTFTLTTGTDNLVGTADNDTFIAGESAGTTTFTVGDQIDGGAGNDTLNWVQTAAITAVPVASKVTSVETVNVTSGSDITLDTTSSFADTTALNTNTSGANQTITAAATQNVTATVALQAANAVAVNGGNNVTINATGVTTGTTTVGATTAAAGNVTVTSTGATLADGAADTTQTQGAIGVTGGSKVNVTTTGTVSGGSDNVDDALTLSAVNVTGNASTTEVTVTQTAAQTQVTGAAGVGRAAIVNGAVTITDANATSATAAGTIATVSLNSYGNSTVNSGALTTLNLAGTGGTLGVTAGALTTPVVDTLGLNVNGLTGGVITLDADYKTLNLAGNTAASTIANVTGTGVTALNISGDANVTLTAQTLAAAKNITVTNTAGAALGTALANDVLFTGGAGADSISIGATTKAINMGAGDDVVTLSSGTLGAGGSLNGGEGVDTLVANTDGSAFVADPAFGGFEVLRVAGAAAKGSHNASGFTALEIGATAAVVGATTTFTGVAAGTGLTVLGNPAGDTTVTLANATGTNDSFGLTLKSDGALTAGSVTLAGVETVNITNTDTDTTAHTNTLTLAATSAKDVVVTGNAGLNLTNANAAITNFDASGVTGAATDAAALAVTFISANTTVGENVTIKGGSGNDSLTGSATANDTIYGNDGADTLVYTGRADVFHGGAGADIFEVNALGTKTAFLTIADADSTDTIDFADILKGNDVFVGAKVTLGGAATLDEYLNVAATGGNGTNTLVKWFQFESNTYIVVDNTATDAFTATDAVVQLTGAIDLSTASLDLGVLSMA